MPTRRSRSRGAASQAAFVVLRGRRAAARPSRVEEAIPFYLRSDRGRPSGRVPPLWRASPASHSPPRGPAPATIAGAADGFAYLIDFWRQDRPGHPAVDHGPQRRWVCCRRVGHAPHGCAVAALSAEAEPGAAAVGPEIARFSGRAFTPVTDLVADAELDGAARRGRQSGAGCGARPRRERAAGARRRVSTRDRDDR